MNKRVYVTCSSCGWSGKRRWKHCEDDRCGEGAICYGSCGWGACKCHARGLARPSEHREQQERWRAVEEWWENEGKHLYGNIIQGTSR